MQKDNTLKDRVKAALEDRGIKVPALAKQTGIPKDRIYAWYRDGTDPKMKDVGKLEKWLNGEKPPKIEENGALIEEKNVRPNLLETLVTKLITLSDTTNYLLQEQKKQLIDKVDKIDANLNVVVALTERIDYVLESGRVTTLRSLARLEKKPVDSLVREADSIKIELAQAKHEHYMNSLGGNSNSGTQKEKGEVKK